VTCAPCATFPLPSRCQECPWNSRSWSAGVKLCVNVRRTCWLRR
jgi:hypothetical protein